MFKKLQVVKLSADFKEACEVVETAIPNDIPDGHLLVKVSHVGVNATDINISAGRYFTDGKVPFDIGLEGLGVVEKKGPNTSLVEGSIVTFLGQGCFAEYVIMPEKELISIKSSDPAYISMLVCGLTATLGLDNAGRIKKGDKVLITAAAGGTGQICVQWAKLRGCHVIGTCSTAEKEAYLKEIGCDKVINYKTSDLDKLLSEEYPTGVDVIWETIGGKMCEMLVEHLGKKARMVVIGAISGYKSVGFPTVNIPELPTKLLMNSSSINGFFLMDYLDESPTYFSKMVALHGEKKLRIQIDNGANSPGGAFRGIADVIRAVEYLHSGKNCGKVVVPL